MHGIFYTVPNYNSKQSLKYLLFYAQITNSKLSVWLEKSILLIHYLFTTQIKSMILLHFTYLIISLLIVNILLLSNLTFQVLELNLSFYNR